MTKLTRLAVVMGLAACTFPQVVPEALTNEYKPTGEVMMRNRGASFDAVRVRAPHCNLSKRTDGSWAGTLNEKVIDVSVTETRISGVDFTLTRENSEGRHMVITGQFDGKIYRFEFDERHALIRAPGAMNFNFDGLTVEGTTVRYGPMGNFELRGEAGSTNPPWPQLGFALLASIQG